MLPFLSVGGLRAGSCSRSEMAALLSLEKAASFGEHAPPVQLLLLVLLQ